MTDGMVEFKNVADIRTDFGNLIKIQDAATGVILWQKKTTSPAPTPTPTPEPSVVEDGFPVLVPVLKNKYICCVDGMGFANTDDEKENALLYKDFCNLEFFDVIEVGSSIASEFTQGDKGLYDDGPRSAYVGDVISFPYANTREEAIHILVKGHSAPMNAAWEWRNVDKTTKVSVGIVRRVETVYPGITDKPGQMTNAELPDLPDFFTLEKSGENSLVIKSIKNSSEYSSYLSALNARYPDAITYNRQRSSGLTETVAGFPKVQYPYFKLTMIMHYYSTSLGIEFDYYGRNIEFDYYVPR